MLTLVLLLLMLHNVVNVNRPTPKGNSYFIIDDCVNQIIGSLLIVDSKSIFSLKPSNIKMPVKSQTGDCCDLSIQEKSSKVLERKSNNAEQQYYF